jgi:hypothetical protein
MAGLIKNSGKSGEHQIFQIKNTLCSDSPDPEPGMQWNEHVNFLEKSTKFKSVRMFHDVGVRAHNGWYSPLVYGDMDYCRFYPERDCKGDYFTDCQGHCNLKNIAGEMRSMKCWWNTTYWPS